MMAEKPSLKFPEWPCTPEPPQTPPPPRPSQPVGKTPGPDFTKVIKKLGKKR